MKKAIIFLIFVPMLFFCIIHNNNNSFYNKFNFYNNAVFCYVYSNKNINQKKQNLTSDCIDLKTINNGDKTLLYFSKLNNQLSIKPDYMQVSFSGSYSDVKNIIKSLNLKEVYFENFESYYIFYGYTSGWIRYKVLNNKKVNFQIVYNNSLITIGYPMIYGSF